MRKTVKGTQTVTLNGINSDIPIHMFENVETLCPKNVQEHNTANDNGTTPVYAKNEIIKIANYEDITSENYSKDGNPDVIKFRKNVTKQLLQLDKEDELEGNDVKEKGFILTIEITEEDIKKYIEIVMYKEKDEEAGDESKILKEEIKGRILIRISNTKGLTGTDDCTYYGINDLTFDSDIDDGLWRLTEKSEWKAKTYLVLDFNKNLMVNKGIYLTLDLPFNNNISWYEPYRKMISGYNISPIIEKELILTPEFN